MLRWLKVVLYLRNLQANDWGVRAKSAQLLGDLGDRRATKELAAVLTDPDVLNDQRPSPVYTKVPRSFFLLDASIAALGRLEDPTALPALESILGAERLPVMAGRPSLKEAAVESVAMIGGLAGAAVLQSALRCVDSRVRERAATALRNYPDVAVPLLVRTLADRSRLVRVAAANALNQLGWSPSTSQERAAFAIINGRWQEVTAQGSAAVEPLLAVLHFGHEREAVEETSVSARAEAATALGSLNDRRAVGPLLEAFRTDFCAVRNAAYKALVRLGWTPETACDQMLADIANDAISSVGSGGARDWGGPIKLKVPHSRPSLDAAALRAVVAESPESVTHLLWALSITDHHVAQRYYEPVKDAGDMVSLAIRRVAMETSWMHVRDFAAEVLFHIKSPYCVGPLVRSDKHLLDDQQLRNREAFKSHGYGLLTEPSWDLKTALTDDAGKVLQEDLEAILKLEDSISTTTGIDIHMRRSEQTFSQNYSELRSLARKELLRRKAG